MANFYTDNEDIQFLFRHMDLARLATLTEEGFRFNREFEFAPADAADAVDNYNRILTTIGEIIDTLKKVYGTFKEPTTV